MAIHKIALFDAKPYDIKSLPNVLITSHQAFFTKEALHNIGTTTLDNLKDYFDGRPLANEICYRCTSACHRETGLPCA